MPGIADFIREKFDLSVSIPEPEGLATLLKEKLLRELIPYTVHYDDETIITKDDGLVQVIKLDGLYYESLTLQQIKQFERQRNTILRSIANSDRGIYVHLVRRKVTSYPGGEGKTWFSRAFNAAWKQHYEQNSFFVNDIYISIVQNRVRQGYPGVIDRIGALFSGEKLTIEDVRTFDNQAKKLYEVSNLLLQTLQSYGAKRLCIQRIPEFVTKNVERKVVRDTLKRLKLDWSHFQDTYGDHDFYDADVVVDYCGQDYSEIKSFLYYLVNLQDERITVSNLPLDRSLAVSRLNSQKKGDTLEIIGTNNHRLASVLTMAEWPARTSSAMLNEFLKLPVEFIITQSFFFLDRVTAEHEEPWAFAVIRDRNVLDRLSEHAKELVRHEASHIENQASAHALELVNRPGFHVFYNANTLIVIYSKFQGPFVVADCWLAAENLMLAACAQGLGTCVIGFAVSALNTPEWKAELGIPADMTAIAPIILGIPDGNTPPVARKEAEILVWK